jgi:peptidoglycan/LPS O-acetylase OafA/YrhL
VTSNPADSRSVRPLDPLTGLRWIAALVVFGHHAIAQLTPRVSNVLLDVGLLACLAVSFFFTLSGFILTYVYHQRLQNPAQRRLFWFTRWARIWPLHAVCLIVFIGMLMDWRQLSIPPEPAKLLFNALLLQSWFPYRDWSFTFNFVSWTISVEAFFYLIFPWLVAGGLVQTGRKTVFSLMLAIGLIAGLCWWKSLPQDQQWIDIDRVFLTNPLLRLPEFCGGILAGYIFLGSRQVAVADNGCANRFFRDSVQESLAVGSLVGCYLALHYFQLEKKLIRLPWGGNGLAIWISTLVFLPFFVWLLLVFARSRGWLGRILGSRLLVLLGEVSFAFYMIHNLVIIWIKRNLLATELWSTGGLIGAALSIGLGASILLHQGLEMPVKESLVRWYQGKSAPWWQGWAQSLRRLVSWTGLVAAGLVIWPAAWAMVLQSQVTMPQTETAQRVSGVRFDQRIELLNAEFQVQNDHLQITLVWKRLDDLPFYRYLNLYDRQGVLIRFGPDNSKVFRRSTLRRPFVDRVQIPLTELTEVEGLGVSFVRLPGGQRLFASHGYRTRQNTHLQLLGRRSLDQLLQSSPARPELESANASANQSVNEFRNGWIKTEVDFGNQFTLLGYRWSVLAAGRNAGEFAIAGAEREEAREESREESREEAREVVELELRWKQRSVSPFGRYLHLCDEEGRVLAQGRPNPALFADFVPELPFVDRIRIPADKWQQAQLIGVGFYDPDSNRMLRVGQPPNSLNGFRYHLLDRSTSEIPRANPSPD